MARPHATPLVARRAWVYTADVAGPLRTVRRRLGVGLIAFFVVAPWVVIGGLPAVRLDIPGRRLILLGSVFTPHDTWALALLALVAVLLLFFFASVFGRVWCGWACPQTVWLDWLYRPLERAIEGRAGKRKAMDAQGWRAWPPSWWARKVAKHAAFVIVTAGTTVAFLAWFVGGPELLRGEIGPTGQSAGGLLFFLFLLDATWFREQLCVYACPYARFQGALMSERSLVVAYDAARGEPRKVGTVRAGGDCISCDRCVSVCPSGIDIREGDQLSCVACASCVDACDAVMVQIGKPKGLIRYTTDRDGAGVRPLNLRGLGRRSLGYLLLIVGLTSVLVLGVARRAPVTVTAVRATSGTELYRRLPDGQIANQLTLHLSNRSRDEHRFTVGSTTPGVTVAAPGLPWTVAWGGDHRFSAFVTAAPEAFAGGRLASNLVVRRDDGLRVDVPFTLLGPGSRPTGASTDPGRGGR